MSNRIKRLCKPFTAPWHVELLAITIQLNEQGYFSYSDWKNCLREQLRQEGKSEKKWENDMPVDDDYYYKVWLTTLVSLLEKHEITDSGAIDLMQQRWVHAYQHTLHGKPVTLD